MPCHSDLALTGQEEPVAEVAEVVLVVLGGITDQEATSRDYQRIEE